MTDNGSKNQSAPATGSNRMERGIYLPSEEYAVQSWKVTAGSPVRAGDKLAVVAVRRPVSSEDSNHTKLASNFNSLSTTTVNSSSTQSSVTTAAAAAANHKRPKKRRRPGPVVFSETSEHESGLAAKSLSKLNTLLQDSTITNNRIHLHQQQQDGVTLIAPADGLLRIISDSSKQQQLQEGDSQEGDSQERDPLLIGYVELCLHPQILMGMCAVCGVGMGAYLPSESGNNVLLVGTSNNGMDDTLSTATTNNKDGAAAAAAMSQVTVSGGITMMVSEVEGQQIAQQTAQRLLKHKKLSLVLDLDHTLVHATYDSRARTHLGRDDVRTVVLPVFENPAYASQRQAWTLHYVKLRPHVKEFLETLQPLYEVGVYTAGTRLYAEQITMVLSRHLVGATMDQPELDGLRHRISKMEYELRHAPSQEDASSTQGAAKAETQRKPVKSDHQQENGKVVAEDTVVVSTEASGATEDSLNGKSSLNAPCQVENVAETNQRNEQPSRTRKHVTFDPTENVGEAAEQQQPEPQDPVRNENGGIDRVVAPVEEQGDDEDVSHRKRVRFGEPGQNSWYNNNQGEQNANDTGQRQQQEREEDDAESAGGGCKRRKRVSFGEPPESSRTDHVNPLVLQELREQLAEAERLEQAANKLRQQLFGSRIVSRTDVADLGKDVKSLRRIFPCGGTMAVVVDDREDVWANALDNASGRKGEPPENLLLVRPYHWKPFLGFADVNNAAGVDLSVEGATENSSPTTSADGNDVQLLWTRDILVRLHRSYFSKNNSNQRKSVAAILSKMRAQVLKNARIVLSSLVPLRKQSRTPSTHVPRPPVVRIVESLGATLLDSVQPTVTHVVSARDGTEKIVRARRIPSCRIVKASWLMECLWSLTRQDERPHLFPSPNNYGSSASTSAVAAAASSSSLPSLRSMMYTNNSRKAVVLPLDPRTETTTSTSGSEDDDDEEDDFAACLENELMDN